MAIFSASLRTFSRNRGDSATAAAAYRAGVALPDERLGLTHDYSRRGGVERVRFVVPKHAPAWATDAARLWNAAEAAEVRRNARVARELIVALPHELDPSARAELSEDIGRMLVERYGAAAMVAVHAPDKRGDQRNHHCHVLFTTRVLNAQGFGAKIRVLDDREQGPREVDALRKTVASLTNEKLAGAGVAIRVDHRTLAVQARVAESAGDYEKAARLTREPTEHVGRAGMAVARRGGADERVEANAARAEDNAEAFDKHLERAQREGRLMAPASDQVRPVRSRGNVKRAHEAIGTVLGGSVRVSRVRGKDAELLNAQAALSEDGARAVREESQAYLDGLRHTAERHASVVDAYLALVSRPLDRQTLLAQCAAHPWHASLLRRSVEARTALQALGEAMPQRRRDYGEAMARTAAEQKTLEALDEQRPSAWKPMTRRQWADKRRAQRARVASAQGAERAARSMTTGAAGDALKAEARELRAEIQRVERERVGAAATFAKRVPSKPECKPAPAESREHSTPYALPSYRRLKP